jgi:hypothetical protein
MLLLFWINSASLLFYLFLLFVLRFFNGFEYTVGWAYFGMLNKFFKFGFNPFFESDRGIYFDLQGELLKTFYGEDDDKIVLIFLLVVWLVLVERK